MNGLLHVRQLIFIYRFTELVLQDELFTRNFWNCLLNFTYIFMVRTVVVIHFLVVFGLLTWTFRLVHNRIV